MTHLRRISLLLAVATVAAGLSAQRTWVVDRAAGPGHDFTTVGAAVAAATAHDTILIRAGTYAELTIDIDKSLSIIGDGAVRLELGQSLGFTEGITVHDLPADQPFTLRGLELGGSFVNPEFRAERCNGLVAIHGVTGIPGPLGVDEAVAIEFVDCAQAHAHDLFVRGGGFVRFVRSRGALTAAVLESEIFGALRIEDSDVTLDRCTITAGSSPFSLSPPLTVTGSSVRLGRVQVTNNSPSSTHAAIDATQSTLVLDPTAAVTARAGVPPVSGNAQIVQRELSTLAVRSAPGTIDLDLQSRVGEVFVTFLSLPTTAAESPWGDLWVHAGVHFVLHAGTLSQQRTDFVRLQTAVIPPGLEAVVQTIVFDTELGLTNGAAIVFE